AVGQLNQLLGSAQSAGHCSLPNPTTIHCQLEGQQTFLPIALQLNDTGFVRLIGSGPNADIVKIEQSITSKGGGPNVTQFNVVGSSVPAISIWSLVGLATALGVIGRVAMRYRGPRQIAV